MTAVGEGRRASLHMEGGLGFQVNSIDADRFTAYLDKGKIPIWDGVAVTTYLLTPHDIYLEKNERTNKPIRS